MWDVEKLSQYYEIAKQRIKEALETKAGDKK